MHSSFDHSASIASLILSGSSLSDGKLGLAGDNTGRLKTLPGDAGGLLGGDATLDEYAMAICSTMDVRESKGLIDSRWTVTNCSFSFIEAAEADII